MVLSLSLAMSHLHSRINNFTKRSLYVLLNIASNILLPFSLLHERVHVKTFIVIFDLVIFDQIKFFQFSQQPLTISYLSRNKISCPPIVIIIENCWIACVTVVSQSSSLQAPELADDTVSGLLSPKLAGAPFISPSGKFQLLLSQPRQTKW